MDGLVPLSTLIDRLLCRAARNIARARGGSLTTGVSLFAEPYPAGAVRFDEPESHEPQPCFRHELQILTSGKDLAASLYGTRAARVSESFQRPLLTVGELHGSHPIARAAVISAAQSSAERSRLLPRPRAEERGSVMLLIPRPGQRRLLVAAESHGHRLAAIDAGSKDGG